MLLGEWSDGCVACEPDEDEVLALAILPGLAAAESKRDSFCVSLDPQS